MVVKFYHARISGPSRGAFMVARALNLPIEVIQYHIKHKEHLNDEFLAINPQHCVPTIVDEDGFVVWESKAIATYLVDKYGKDDTLYPKDLKKRTLVDQRLHFDNSFLSAHIIAVCDPVRLHGEKEYRKDAVDNLNRTLGFLDMFLSKEKWLAGGNHYTIADILTYATLYNIIEVGWDMTPFPNIQRWVEDCAHLPGKEETAEGAEIFGDIIKDKQNRLTPEKLAFYEALQREEEAARQALLAEKTQNK